MWELTINGIDFYHILNWFFIYSFFGWLWETFYVSIKQGEFINRGFISGPFCTIYGFGAIFVYVILKPVEENLLLLFLGGIIVATLLEYFTAVLMESIFHTSWWDYSDVKFNFQGRICLGASLGWGVFSVILFRVLHPLVSQLVNLYPVYAGKIGVCVLTLGYLWDFFRSASAAFHLKERIPHWEEELEKKQAELMLKLNKRLNALEISKNNSFESVKERIEDFERIRAFNEKHQEWQKEIAEELHAYRKVLAERAKGNTRRFLKSYPHLNRGYRMRHKKDHKNESH